MDVDAELMFDCLLYLNLFYFPVFGICESIMCIAKYRSIILTSRIGIDAAVVSSVLFAEMLKLVIYRKLREHRKGNTYTLFFNTSVFNGLFPFSALQFTSGVSHAYHNKWFVVYILPTRSSAKARIYFVFYHVFISFERNIVWISADISLL